MKFIKSVSALLKKVTWPTKKEAGLDFVGVLEYTAFFTVIIFAFDKLITAGITLAINFFNK